MEHQTSSEQRGPFHFLVGIIFRPRATFRHLNESGRRSWWLPALLAVLMAILPIIAATPISTRQALEALEATQGMFDPQTLSPEQKEQMERAREIVASPLFVTVIPSVQAVLGMAVGWLVWAGVLYLAGMALGGRASFGNLFRMVIWAWIPYAIRGFLQTLYILLTGQVIAHPGLSGLVVDNRGAKEILAAPPPISRMVAAAFLGRIDLFLFWNLALLVVGTVVVTRLSTRKATALVIGIWVLLALIGLVPTLIGSLFMGRATVTVGG